MTRWLSRPHFGQLFKAFAGWPRPVAGLALLLAALLMTGCDNYTVARAVLPVGSRETRDEAAKQIEELCVHEAGTRIHRTADNIRGFVLLSPSRYKNGRGKPATELGSSGCGFDCIMYFGKGYSYIEATVGDKISKSGLFDFAPGPGRYKYHLISAADSRCTQYKSIMAKYRWVRSIINQYADVFRDKCIYAQPIVHFESEYAFQPFFDEEIERTTEQIILAAGSRVIDRRNQQELATKIGYVVNAPHRLQVTCGVDGIMDVTTVLKPLTGLKQL